jgi:N-acetylglutamate synthase-like GNAT family acetyltransferase
MTTEVEIERMTQSDNGFWELMGPFFASASIRRDLGIPMSSNQSYSWFLAIAGDVVGFCATVPMADCVVIKHLYVTEKMRRQGIGGRLINSAVASSKGRKIATISSKYLSLWSKCGFSSTGVTRGQYIKVSNE